MALTQQQQDDVDLRVRVGMDVLREEMAGIVRTSVADLETKLTVLDTNRQALAEAHNSDVVKLQVAFTEKTDAMDKFIANVDLNATKNINDMKKLAETFENDNSIKMDTLEGGLMNFTKTFDTTRASTEVIVTTLREQKSEVEAIKLKFAEVKNELADFISGREKNFETHITAAFEEKDKQLSALALTLRRSIAEGGGASGGGGSSFTADGVKTSKLVDPKLSDVAKLPEKITKAEFVSWRKNLGIHIDNFAKCFRF